MALPVFFDRVQETSTTTGTGTLTLAGAVNQFQAFSSVIPSGTALVYYTITDATSGYEIGQGTYTFSGTTLSRTTILASSNANAAVSWGAGTKNVWLDYPASLVKPAAFIGVVETTVDFGSTPVGSAIFTVTDANITSAHNIIATQSADATSNRTADENGIDLVLFSATAGTGQFTLYAEVKAGVITGQVDVHYIYS